MTLTRARQTAIFLAIALGGSYAIGAVWVAHPEWGWLSQFLMCTPAVAALVLQALRREPPRALGFGVGSGGAGPWVAAFLYPLAVIAICVALGYALRFITGADVIHFQPEAARGKDFGVSASGLGVVGLRLARNLLVILPWLVLAIAYRLALPEKLGPGRHVARAALWAGVLWCYPGPWWLPPGAIGEELGWRGWLARVWRDRPLVGLALSAGAWVAFHLPVVVLMPPLHAVGPALSFLLAIAAAAAAFQALYLVSGSIWPPAIAHLTWNVWNPLFLGNQYGPSRSIFGGEQWLINGEGLLGMLVNGAVTVALVLRYRASRSPRRP